MFLSPTNPACCVLRPSSHHPSPMSAERLSRHVRLLPVLSRLFVLLSLLCFYLAPSASCQSSVSITSLLAQNQLSASSHTSAYILTPLSLAYQLVNPLFTLSNTDIASAAARAQLYAQSIDVAFVAATPTAAELTLYPNVISLPYSVVPTVVIYNLPSLGSNVTVLLSAPTLGQIFTGQITWWNSTAVQLDNPTLTLPQQPITVVLPVGPYTTSQILLHTLILQYPALAASINASLSPAWPYASYATYLPVTGLDGPSGAVLTTPYSIGYSVWSIAAQNGNRISAQKNSGGRVVTINSTTLELAIVEGSTIQIQQVISTTGQQSSSLTSLGSSNIDLASAAGKSSWPMLGMEYMMIDTQYSRTTCHSRAGLVDFLVWIVTDESAALVLTENYFGSLPDLLLSQLDIVNQLQTTVMCRGSAAASLNIVASTEVQVSVDTFLTDSQVLLAQTFNYYLQTAAGSLSTGQLSLTVQSNPSQLVFDQQRFLEVDMGLLFAERVDSALFAAYHSQQPPSFLLAPLFLTAAAPIYNRQLSVNITLPASHPVNLTSPLIVLILQGIVSSWLDPRVLQYNPYLAALAASLPQPQFAPVTQVIPCSIGAVSLLYLERLIVQSPSAAEVLSASQSIDYCAAGLPSAANLQFVEREDMELGAAQANIGSFAYTMLSSAVSNMPSVGVASLLSNVDQRQQTATNQTVGLPFIAATAETMLACLEGSSAKEWQANLADSSVSGCWPLTTAVVAMVPLSYSSAVSTNACAKGSFIYSYLVTLYNSSDYDDVFHAQLLPRAAEVESVRLLIDQQVQSVTCDNTALLGAKPLQYAVSSSVSSFGYAMSAIGLTLAVTALLLVAIYSHNAIIAGAQPLLLAAHALGSAVLLVSVIVLVRPATAGSCSFLLWAWNVGSTLTFAPLYGKVYRWYRMYGRGRHVHRVPNLHLYMAVAVALLADVAFTAAWQSQAPLQPQLSSRTSSGEQTDYVQCGFDETQPRTAFLLTAAFVKGGALLLFTVMAFTVRRVLVSYKENASVAYSLYNTCCALLLLVPITALIAAIGDVLVVLLTILLLWLSITPLLLVFGPRAAILLFGAADGGANAVNPVLSAAKSVSLGFSFLPVNAMADQVLDAYIQAVEAQLADAKRRMGGKADDNDDGEASNADEDEHRPNTRSKQAAAAEVRRRTGSGHASPALGSHSQLSVSRGGGQR